MGHSIDYVIVIMGGNDLYGEIYDIDDIEVDQKNNLNSKSDSP